MTRTARKENGIHYTPPELAAFLARQMLPFLPEKDSVERRDLRVLDPACGDGELLRAFGNALAGENATAGNETAEDNATADRTGQLFGFDTDVAAVQSARRRLAAIAPAVQIREGDFLDSPCDDDSRYDCVISNPPYVRTQVIGAQRSVELASRFGLTGRIDLYQVFTKAISRVLRPGGVLGLLTSNRFLSVRAGSAMRRLLEEDFELKQIFDLGDTRLFDASVLPVVVIAIKRENSAANNDSSRCNFHRIYREQWSGDPANGASKTEPEPRANRARRNLEILSAVSGELRNVVSCGQRYRIDRGGLRISENGIWSLTNPANEHWLNRLKEQQHCTFRDLATVKVGIKTTANPVFIRSDWAQLDIAPEPDLLHPLLTHHVASRWRATGRPQRRVLYPYRMTCPVRRVVCADEYPAAFAYFERHRERLQSRRYLVDAGRNWFEIWVPHIPAEWCRPKIVWPDIARQPRFYFDDSGAIVGGDSYWMQLRPNVDPDWLYLLLGVANSSVATKFYDVVFHNKLYAGRRRFMTQYVNEFPVPDLKTPASAEVVELVRRRLEVESNIDSGAGHAEADAELDVAVELAFGLSVPLRGTNRP